MKISYEHQLTYFSTRLTHQEKKIFAVYAFMRVARRKSVHAMDRTRKIHGSLVIYYIREENICLPLCHLSH
jgi:hypothetical protein